MPRLTKKQGDDRPAKPVKSCDARALDPPMLPEDAVREIDEIHDQISRKLWQTRLRLNLRQQDVATVLGMSGWQLSKYERSTNRIRADLLVRFARVYNISIMDLLPSEAAFTATPINADLFKLFAEVESLPERDRKTVHDRLRKLITRVKQSDRAPGRMRVVKGKETGKSV